MPLAARRILFVLFVLFFVLAAIGLLLYANGYRYHTATRTLEKTGQLILKTQPAGATFQLNGIQAADPFSGAILSTPATASYLIPGDYTLVIQKQGFYAISRAVTITSGQTSIPPSFTLIKKSSIVSRVMRSSILNPTLTDSGIMYHDGKMVYLFDESAEKESVLFSSSLPIARIIPSPSGKLAVVMDTKGGWMVCDQNGVRVSSANIQTPLSDFRWFGDDLYALSNQGVVHIDRDAKTITTIYQDKGVVDFSLATDMFVLIKNPTLVLKRVDSTNGKEISSSSDIPPVSGFYGNFEKYLILKGAVHSFDIFDTTSSPAVFQEVQNANTIAFVDQHNFFTNNDFEIWSHTIGANEYMRTLVTRQSTPITNMTVFAHDAYLITVSGGHDVRIRDLQTNTNPETQLASFDEISALFLNKDETSLMVVGMRNGAKGIFELPLIEREQLFPLMK